MSLATLVALGLAGGAGAVARVALAVAVTRRRPGPLPAGTLAANVLGSFGLGVLVGAGLDGSAYDVAAAGLLGAFTTFSTWVVEAQRLAAAGRPGLAGRYLAVSLALGLLAAWAGRTLGAVP